MFFLNEYMKKEPAIVDMEAFFYMTPPVTTPKFCNASGRTFFYDNAWSVKNASCALFPPVSFENKLLAISHSFVVEYLL